MATNPPPPSERASEIIEKLPSSPNLITKTGTALLGVGAAATAISQELYVVNEETIVLIASIMVFTYIGKVFLFRRYPFLGRYWRTGGIRSWKSHTPSGRRVTFSASRRFSTMLVLNTPARCKSVLTPLDKWRMSSRLLKLSSPSQRSEFLSLCSPFKLLNSSCLISGNR